MSDHITRDELDTRFDDLKDFIALHVKGVTDRQDITNGRIEKVEVKVEDHDRTIFQVKTLWGAGAVIVGAFGHQIFEWIKAWLKS
jgi:hypothetical protein